jgi:hypothetical protein
MTPKPAPKCPPDWLVEYKRYSLSSSANLISSLLLKFDNFLRSFKESNKGVCGFEFGNSLNFFHYFNYS